MSREIKTVAVAGASGNIGPQVVSALLDANFRVTVLTRSTDTTFPSNVTVKPVDYDSVSALTDALQGIDAVVAVLGVAPAQSQINLFDAASAAGVVRFIPSEFGSDTTNPRAAQLPVFKNKVLVQKHLAGKATSTSSISYSLIITGLFLDMALERGLLPGKESYDGGDRPFSATPIPTVAKAIVGVLKHLPDTKNRAVYVQGTVLTQRQLAAIVERVNGTKWDPVPVETAQLEKDVYAELQKPEPNFTLVAYGGIKRAIWGEGYGGLFQNPDNELLGLGKSELNDEELETWVRKLVK